MIRSTGNPVTRRLGDGVGTGGQLVTIAAVLVGALTTHLTNHLMERSRNRHRLLTRWDDKKVDAYGEYVDAAKMRIAASVRLYEARENLREDHRPEEELREDLAEAGRRWGSAFERVMLLGGDEAIEAGHELNKLVAEIDWQATGRITGTLEEWRERHRAAFRAINAFHEEARTDLGIRGSVTGDRHPERDLLLPSARQVPARRTSDRQASAGD
ncbi:hypothetical protein EF913_11370 [Streptomyces sp. WAC04189]|nr:hypothetical protein DBP22_27485 [Streptomyces sp. CS207]QCB27027.1 hypothetical protein E5N77_18150 [Streptomyces sp. SS52]QCR51562.1 hypothetical protein C1N79_18430 [Streptomyces sp. SGAir0924]RSS03476.1 hypothetical protein EF913_11370 [Streptomyces sp. WAC04189]RSS15317.1 hypothetical protein EF915_14845 [Streptomyces sp. WAC08401]RSS27260.1 hypothetical protein EF914_00805 [Streptomyces sp. WAC05458]RSS30461.1 hypothetical protein EF916_08425 [Streptomyces sp. WAC08452]RSS64619.1 hy